MQHIQDQSDGQVEMTSPTASVPSTSSTDHINLTEFPSHLDYSSVLDHNRQVFQANDSSDISPHNSGLIKSAPFSSGGRSRLTNLMYPKGRRRPFQCKYCPFSCPSATNLSIHMRIHTGEKPYKCGTCCYASARKQNLFRHMSTVHKADHVTMCGSTPAMCAYPIGIQSGSDDRMPVVENVYGSVQDVVLIDGDPVQFVGGDQGRFPVSEPDPPSPRGTPVFPGDSANSTSPQDDIVEVLPVSVSSSAPISEYSTRHYADGSRFIFASGTATATASSTGHAGTSPKVCSPQISMLDHHFESSKETQKMQTQNSIVSNEGPSIHVQSLISPDKAPVNKPESPLQHALYKEPTGITGALKRKQGRVSSHSTLKNILDSPLVLGSKVCASLPSVPPKSLHVSSANHLEKTGTEIKIIQTEEDLEEVLEGRQKMDVRVAPSGVGKHQDFTPSSRSLNGCSSVEPLAFSYPRESPDTVYYPESNTTAGRTNEDVRPSMDAILPSQTSMFRHRHVSTMKPSSARKVNEPKRRSGQRSNEDVIVVEQTSKRAVLPHISSQRNQIQQSLNNPSQLNIRDRSSLPKENEERAESLNFHRQNTLVRRQNTNITCNQDQSLQHGRPLKESCVSPARTSLTIQVDLNKLLCCAARKWLKAHMVDCDVCEINLPSSESEDSCLGNGSGRCGKGRCWAQENDQGYLTRERCQSNPSDNTDDDQMQLVNRKFTSGVAEQVERGEAVGRIRQNLTRDGQEEVAMPYSRTKQQGLSHNKYPSFTETSVVRSSSVPISSTTYFRADAARTVDHRLTRNIGEPQESTEYIAFLNAEQARGKAASKRKGLKLKHVCDICEKVCNSKALLLSHRRVHIETSQLFRCAVCRYCTLHYKLLKRHISDKHSAASKKNSVVECTICRKAVRVTEVSLHMQTEHGHVLRAADGTSVDGNDSGKAECSMNHTTTITTESQGPNHLDAVAMEMDADAAKKSEASQAGQEDSTTEDGGSVQEVAMAIKQETEQED